MKSREPGRLPEAAFGSGFLRDIWHFACLSRDLRPARLRRLVLCGEPVVMGRTAAGAAFALRDVCPHRAAPLSAGRVVHFPGEEAAVECAYHGWRFSAAGRCLAIPSLARGQDFDPGRVRVRAFAIAESAGLAFVWMGGRRERPDVPPPILPKIAATRPRLVIRARFSAHMDQAVVGLMDPAHGPFVHQQWWWRSRGSAHLKQKRFEPRPMGFAMIRHAPSANSRPYALLGGAPTTEITFQLPGLRWEHVEIGARQVLALTCLTPIGERATGVTQIVWSDHPLFAFAGPLIGAAARRFLSQDAAMIELQNLNSDSAPAMMLVDDADRQAKWYQALKREWVAHRVEDRPFDNPVEPASLRWIS